MLQENGEFVEVDTMNNYENADRGPDMYYYYVLEVLVRGKLFTLYTQSLEDRERFYDALSNNANSSTPSGDSLNGQIMKIPPMLVLPNLAMR